RVAGPQLHRRPQALVLVGRGHADVGHHDVGLVVLHRLLQGGGVAHGGDDVVAGVGQESGQPRPQQDGVFGDHDAHGSSTVRMVGPPGGLTIRSVPSTAWTRSARPARPVPRLVSAPPMPSSVTSTLRWPFWRATVTAARLAPECRAMLVSASATTK